MYVCLCDCGSVHMIPVSLDARRPGLHGPGPFPTSHQPSALTLLHKIVIIQRSMHNYFCFAAETLR